ncbi:MAG: hypothetical protein ABIS29_05765 [Vicinamibacterales bacterium]
MAALETHKADFDDIQIGSICLPIPPRRVPFRQVERAKFDLNKPSPGMSAFCERENPRSITDTAGQLGR